MKMRFSRFLAFILTLTMLLTMIPAVMAEGEVTEVDSFAALVEAVKKDGTVKLTGDIALTGVVTVPSGKTVTLDLNGKTITSNDGANAYIDNSGSLTILDSATGGAIISNSKSGSGSNILCLNNNGALTVESGNFTVNSCNRSCYTVYSKGPSVTINGGTFAANYTNKTGSYVCHTLGLGGTDSVVTITGGSFTATSASEKTDTRCAPIYVMKECNVQITVSDGTFTGNRTVGTNGATALRIGDKATPVITIAGGSFSAKNAGTDGFINGLKGTLSITGGTFTYDGTMFSKAPTAITGGTFLKTDGTKNDISTYLAEDYTQMEDGAVMKVTTADSYEALCAAMKTGGYIQLTAGFELTGKAQVPAGVTVILDLKGQTITSNDGANAYIDNSGSLTILDSATGGAIISNSKSGSGSNILCLNNNGALTVESGNFTVNSCNRSCYTVYSKGPSVTINGGTFAANYTNKTGSYVCHTLGLGGTDSVVTITGGSFTATSASEKTDTRCAPIYVMKECNVQITVSDGTFTGNRTVGTNGATALRIGDKATPVITIAGGSFSAKNAGTDGFINGLKGTLSITGGTFTYDGTMFSKAPTAITGGTFLKTDGTKNDISANVTEGFVQGSDGTVTEGPSVNTYVSRLIAYYEAYQDAAATDIQRVLEEMAVLDADAAAAWEKIMDYWREVNTEGFVQVGTVEQGLPNDNSLCIVILGYKLNDDGTMQDELIGRLQTGLAAANAYPNAYVCVTGGGTAANNPDVTEGDLMGQWLLSNGLAESRLIIEDEAGSTVGNAKNTYTILNQDYPQVKNILLVTSDYHVARGSILYYTKFVLEAMATGGQEIGIVSNVGYDTNKNYEAVSAQASSMRSLAGVGSTDVALSVLESLTVTQAAPYVTGNDLALTVNANYDSGYSKSVNATVTGFDKTQNADQLVTIAYTENGVTISGEMRLTETKTELVGRITEVDSFAELSAAVQENCTIKLIADIALESLVEIPAGKTVVLDLNGKTLSSDKGDTVYISNAGTLLVRDSSLKKTGTITDTNPGSEYNAVYGIRNTGDLTIDGGNISVTSSRGTSYAVYSTAGNVTINGGTFASTYTGTSYRHGYGIGVSADAASLTINGGTVTAVNSKGNKDSRVAAILIGGGSPVVTVKGGTFTCERTTGDHKTSVVRCASSATPNMTFAGGTFTVIGGTQRLFDFDSSSSSLTLTVAGGTFHTDGTLFGRAPTAVTGGTFLNGSGTKVCDVTAYITESYAQLDNGSVVLAADAPTLAQIGDTAYKSLWEVFAKSEAGDTITLAADAKSLETIALSEAVILDLNGYILEAAGVFASDSQIIDSRQAGLLKLPQGYAAFNTNNSQLPLWDAAAGGYRMADTKIQVKDGGSGKFYFRFDLTNAEWEALLPANDISLLVRVDGYTETYAVPQQWLDALYADTTGRGAIRVTFLNAPAQMDIQVSVANGEVEVSKATKSTALAPVSPSGSVDTLASDVREYLAAADELYDGLTSEQLDQQIADKTLTSPKTADTSLYNSKQPVIFQWRWNDPKAVPADSEFVIELSKTETFTQTESIACTHFNGASALQYEPIWNLETAATYYWRVTAKLPDGTVVTGETMTLTTQAGPRLLTIGGVSNARDLGGWETTEIELSDGTVLPAGRTPQGLVYRSGRLESATAEGIDVLVNDLGIRSEIDLRNPNTNTQYEKAVTCLEEYGVYYMHGTGSAKQYGEFITNPTVAAPYLRVFANPDNYPIIFHCRGGADRTGSLAFILNALQGVSEADLIKDYEFTKNRMVQGANDGTFRDFPGFLEAFHALEGDTTYEKARTFCRSAGLTDEEIDTIILLMRGA